MPQRSVPFWGDCPVKVNPQNEDSTREDVNLKKKKTLKIEQKFKTPH